MDKIYRHLPWLSAAEACEFLGLLTKTVINVQTIRKLCTEGLCNAYVNCQGVLGTTEETRLKVCADGIQLLVAPSQLTATEYPDQQGTQCPALEAFKPLMRGPVVLYTENGTKTAEDVEWQQTNGQLEHLAIFKRAEIEALADKLNLTVEERNQAKELLQQQLDHEIKARIGVEQELIELKQELILAQAELAQARFGHHSEGLNYLTEALSQFWSTFDPEEPSTAPSKSDVVKHLVSKGASQNQAEAVDLILRPHNLRNAHLKNRRA